MVDSYWHKQTADKPLFPDIEWSRPEQKSKAGKLGIVGGNKLGFAGVADGYGVALSTKVGEQRVLLPDVLRKVVPPVMTDAIFAPSNPSGGLSREALSELKALGFWADGILMIGDAGRNSETAILYEDFLREYQGPLTLTRDALDLIKNASTSVVEREDTLLVVSFSQLQKLFQTVYYPIVLTFSMQLTNLVEALHKFTITYPVTIMVLHKDSLVIANGGEVVTTPWDNPMSIWRGEVATKATVYWLWNKDKPLESAVSSLLKSE